MHKTVVHCTTQEEAESILNKYDSLGYKWGSGTSLKDTKWDRYKTYMGYVIHEDKKHITYLDIETIGRLNNTDYPYFFTLVKPGEEDKPIKIEQMRKMNILQFANNLVPGFSDKWNMYNVPIDKLLGKKVMSIVSHVEIPIGSIGVISSIKNNKYAVVNYNNNRNYTYVIDTIHHSVKLHKNERI